VIDLDLLIPDEVPEAWPVNSRRRWLTVGTLLLVLLAVSGAVVPLPPGLVQVRTATLVPTSTYRIMGDTLYVAEARADGNRVTAYPLDPGVARWSTPVDVLASDLAMDEIADVVLVGMFQPGVSGDHTVALDRRTGTVRWHSPLNVAALDRVRDRVVLTEYPAAGLGSGPPPTRIVVLTAATGRRVWTYQRDSGCEGDLPYTVDRPGTGLALLCRDGTLTVVDLDTGRVRASVDVPQTADLVQSRSNGYTQIPFGARVAGLPDRVVVSYPAAGRTVLISFEEDRLREDWTSVVDQGNYGILDCGPRICLGNATTEVALDRGTGAVVWRVRPVGFATPLIDRYVLVAPAEFGDVHLVDVGTGEVVMDLGGWTVEAAPTGRPMFFRSDGATGRTWVARLAAGSAGVEVLGFVPNARAETCGSAGGYVVCRTVRDTIGVWRYNGS